MACLLHQHQHCTLAGIVRDVILTAACIAAPPCVQTELCRNWLLGRNCRYGAKCQFAHGQWELQPKPAWPTPPPEKEGEGQEEAAEAEAGSDGCAASVCEDGAASMVAAVQAGRESAVTAPGGAMSRQGSAGLLHSDIATALSAPQDTPAASAAAHLAGYRSTPTSADRLMGGSIDNDYFLGHIPSEDLISAPLSAPMSATMVAVGGAAHSNATVTGTSASCLHVTGIKA